MKTCNLTENLFWTAALAILAGGGAVQTKRRNRMLWAVVCLAELAAGGAAWGAEGARMVFDRAGGFTAAAGEEVRIGARVEGGGGYGIARWEGNAPGRAEGGGKRDVGGGGGGAGDVLAARRRVV